MLPYSLQTCLLIGALVIAIALAGYALIGFVRTAEKEIWE
jgi:hypothetical protein